MKSSRRFFPLISSLLASVILCQAIFLTVANAQGRLQRTKKPAAADEDRRVAHVLSRLTFGARPGDFEKVKAMGVDAFIAQQLDPDSIEDGAAIAKIKKLPTIGMATPVIIEQYTPPKPVAVPSPTPAKAPDNATASPQKAIAQTPTLSPNSTTAAMQNEMQMGAKKEDGKMSAPDSVKPGEVTQ